MSTKAIERQLPPLPAPLTDTLDNALTAADFALARIGAEHAGLLVNALSAGWLTRDEYAALEPLAVAVAYLSETPLPQHRSMFERGQHD